MKDLKRIKIGFITKTNPADKQSSWAGTSYFMAKALQEHVGEVCYLGPVTPKYELFFKLLNGTSLLILKKRYDYLHSIFRAKLLARAFKQEITKHSPDLIFAPIASSEIAYLNTNVPIVYTSDATFSLLENYYKNYTNLLAISRREGERIEELAIRNSALLFYPTEWVAHSALRTYHADSKKIHIVPYGANLENIPSHEVVLSKRKSNTCRLLFLGADWERKGGDIAFETLLKMEESGTKTELIICGCTPPKGISHKDMVVIPYLDKNDKRQLQKLTGLLFASDFLLLPTRSEASAIVFCEANAFGLPAITTATGGVTCVVRNGENGFALPYDAKGDDYARTILDLYKNDDLYLELRKSSRAAYESRLNWSSWAHAVGRMMKEFC